MKRLLLLRHAKSSWSDPKLEDHERPLSRRGVADAGRLAKSIADTEELRIDFVLCSSAVRARQTWAHLEPLLRPSLGVEVTRDLYLPSSQALLARLSQLPKDAETVLVIGHNPALEGFALALVREGDPSLIARLAEKFPTCGLCVLELPIPSFEALARSQATLRSFVTPRDLHGSGAGTAGPTKSRPIELEQHPRLHETASRVLAAAAAQLRENAEGAYRGENPEYVHQMRVGVRRLRVALRFFRGALDEARVEHIEGELAWLFRALGPLREVDVFCEQVLRPLGKQPGLASLQRALANEHAELLVDAQRSIESERFLALVRDLAALQTDLADPKGQSGAKLKPFARKKLDRRLHKLGTLESAVETRDVTTLHDLRKQLKKLRYACEFVRGAFPERRVRRYLKRLSRLQDVLGELNDVAVGERLLAVHLRRIPARGPRHSLRDQVRGRLDAAAVHASLELADTYKEFQRSQPFWRA
jgi:phosphohistidine phosphatase